MLYSLDWVTLILCNQNAKLPQSRVQSCSLRLRHLAKNRSFLSVDIDKVMLLPRDGESTRILYSSKSTVTFYCLSKNPCVKMHLDKSKSLKMYSELMFLRGVGVCVGVCVV